MNEEPTIAEKTNEVLKYLGFVALVFIAIALIADHFGVRL